MKKLLLLLLVATIYGCTSKEEKAQELIKKSMFETLYDFQSYEPINEAKVDSLFASAYNDSIAVLYANKYIVLMSLSDEASEKAEKEIESMKIWGSSSSSYGLSQYNEAKSKATGQSLLGLRYLSNAMKYSDSLKLRIKTIEPKFIGYKMIHKFRCKNKGGNYSIGNYEYTFDPSIEKIITITDLDDEVNENLMELITTFINAKDEK